MHDSYDEWMRLDPIKKAEFLHLSITGGTIPKSVSQRVAECALEEILEQVTDISALNSPEQSLI
jgi:hypothetical protein